MSLSASTWEELLDNYFRVPGGNVYVLGSFAGHATLYSQQVRALNLISGLRATGRLQSGTKVAIVGGGPSGLTAAAAAAHMGSMVVITDRLPKPMSILRNSRQRYLHPYLYDWPMLASIGARAELPFLPWTADYAGHVAEEIEASWKRIADTETPDSKITYRWGARALSLSLSDRPRLTFSHPRGNWDAEADLAILAVGFGIEPEGPGGSYWSDDDLDGYFRDRKRQVLVSGVGDGALVDIMRLRLMDFRHDKIWDRISNVASIDDLGKELLEICSRNASVQEIHKHFRNAAGLGQTWDAESKWGKVHESILTHLQPDIRTDIAVTVASKDGHIYGGRSSILNRLIVSQIQRLEPSFDFLPKAVDRVDRRAHGPGYTVSFSDGTQQEFDVVVMRHGPNRDSGIDAFPHIKNACVGLAEKWRTLSVFDQDGPNADLTRKPQWAPDDYETQTTRSSGRKVSASELRIEKEVREDGNCYLRFVIDGLSVHEGTLKGIRFAHSTLAGAIGQPLPDNNARSLGLTWKSDDDEEASKTGEDATAWPRRLSGIFTFAKPITPSQPPVRFGFEIRILNGHARTTWEHLQMYGRRTRTHDVEVFERPIWFPVRRVRILLSLPLGMNEQSPRVKTLKYGSRTRAVAQDILHMDQPHVERTKWKASTSAPTIESAGAEGVWKVTLEDAEVGTMCRLEWDLPDSEERPTFARAREIRNTLVAHAEERWNKENGNPAISEAFSRLSSALMEDYKEVAVGDVDFSLITYNETTHQLVMVEAHTSTGGQSPVLSPPEQFKRPYGLGVSGASFKDGNHARLYLRPHAVDQQHEPSLYLRAPGRPAYATLLAFPLNFLSDSELAELPPGEMARACLGVITIGTTGRSAELSRVLDSEEKLEKIRTACDAFLLEALPELLSHE